ncbi:S41 family peptidase [Clostridiales bacterium COT073_COT-073]|nr:S41 family peptidase [Clostridiales bacterium COT073_COT-073]
MKAKYYWLGVLSALLVVALMTLAVLVINNTRELMTQIAELPPATERAENAGSATRNNRWFEQKVREIDRQLNQRYIEEIDKDKMYEAAVKGYVDALGDPYTNYLTREEFEEFNRDLSGTYEGIGVPIVRDADTKAVTIIAPYKDSPGEKAGLKAGDIIVAVDGDDIAGIEVDEVARRIRGQKGTQVTLTVQRKKGNKFDVLDIPIIRDEVIIPTIEAKMLEEQIGYIAIFGFDEPTADQFSRELNQLKNQGIKGLIIDLRGNPGGYLEIATEIADEIMHKGLVVYIEDKNGNREDFSAVNSAKLEMPIAVLVDGGSASASEILAGALKDHKLATIVGTTTFGKGLVQNTIPFLDGSALKVTIAKYYTPNGHYIHSKGIEPDVKVELEEPTEDTETADKNKMDNQLQKAWEIIKQKI